MLTHEDNEKLCRVGPGTPMGKTLRRYWHPVTRSARLERDGAPLRIRLLGENFVVFRATDGRVGFFDEACPHRCASLALARNEGNGLRCLYHGWKFDVSGKTVDVPTEQPERREAFARKVPLKHYTVREAGGMVWVHIDKENPAPPFPAFEFVDLQDDQIDVRSGLIKSNWLQLLESVLDSAHLSFLHSGVLFSRPVSESPMSEGMRANFTATTSVSSPTFEILEKPYGFREGAVRDFGDGRRFAKIREFVAPYCSFLPGFPGKPTRRKLVMSVPIDDETCTQWVLNYRTDAAFEPGEIDDFWRYANPDPDNFLNPTSGPDDMWGQDRAAMKEGHFSGFPNRHFFEEDMIVQESMGSIVDRTREYLSQSDKTIIHVRRQLLKAADAVQRGEAPWGLRDAASVDYARIRSCAVFLEPGQDWTEVDAFLLAAEPDEQPGSGLDAKPEIEEATTN
ncbi:Rieske 2Fe-2S domain-containing protein [Ottowia thiooxydans]|uniref:Phthalate 4,5-dioxygenase oxygenase subunit n=1 Tax=Ottowia thiooxydans TaxID=219182 RepID=A0ABV2QEH4_9BURK